MKNSTGKLIFTIVLACVLAVPLSLGAQQKAGPRKDLSFGTSSTGSTFYIITVGMANLITKQMGVNVTAEPVGGSDANVYAVKGKKIDLAMLNTHAVAAAYAGAEQFSKAGKVPLRVLIQGQESLRYIIARKSSGIETAADFKGKKVIGKRRAAVDVEMVTNGLLKAYNLPKESVKILEAVETNEVLDAIKIGAVDAVVVQAGVRASNLMDLANSTDVIFLSVPDDKLQVMLKELGPAFHKGTVPAGTYKGQAEAVHVPALFVSVCVLADFSEDLAYAITKTLMENQPALKAVHAVGAQWTLKSTLSPPAAPYHPGAIKYFKEKKVWNANLEKVQQELLKAGGN